MVDVPDKATFRLPRNIAKFRLPLPKDSIAYARIFKPFIQDGSITETTLPFKTVIRLCEDVRNLGLPKNFIIKRHPKIGFGIFTEDKIIKKKTVVAIYTGKYILHRIKSPERKTSLYMYGIQETIHFKPGQYKRLVKEKILRSRKEYNPQDEYEITLDAAKEGNWARFINHSDNPNCSVELRKIEASKNNFIILPVIIAKRDIKPGTQVTTDYGKEYWKSCGIKKRHVKPSEFY